MTIGPKATSPTPAQRDRGRANSGKVSRARKQQEQTPAERWQAALPGVLERFMADMAERYAETSRDEIGK